MAGRSKENDKDGGRRKLRADSEKIASEEAPDIPEALEPLSPEAVRKLLHELRLHQIELEMQNEELRTAQEKLEESRAQYFELYDLAPVGYFSISEKGIILEANLTGANLLGAAPRDLRARQFSSFIFKGEGNDVLLEETAPLHLGGLLMAPEPELVHIGLRKFVLLRHHLGRETLGHEHPGLFQVTGHENRVAGVDGNLHVGAHPVMGHHFHPAGDHNLACAGCQGIGGHVDGRESGVAIAVNGGPGDAIGKIGQETGDPADVAALLPDLGETAEQNILNFFGIEFGGFFLDPRDDPLEDGGHEILG